MTFELRDLECFMEIVEHRSFGRAATACGMTQPALSRRIAALERGIGTKLFSRERRQIELTAAGEALAREAIAVLSQAHTAERALRDVTQAGGYLRLGTRSVSRFVLLPAAIRRFRRARENVLVTITDTPLGMQFENLRKGVFDVTILRGPGVLGADLRVERLRTDRIGVALPEEHPLAAAPVVDLRELRDEPFVEFTLFRAYGYKELVRRMCARAGFVPKVVQEVESFDGLVTAVASGVAIALVHDASRDLPLPGVVYRPLRPKQPSISLQAVWRADNPNPAIEPFVSCLKDVAAAHGREPAPDPTTT